MDSLTHRSISPKFHQKICINTSLAQDKENSRSRSKSRQMGQNIDFSDGVPHNVSFTDRLRPKLHQKKCIDTNLAQNKENRGQCQRSRSNGPETRFFRQCIRTNVSFTNRLRSNCNRRCASTQAWRKAKRMPDQGQRTRLSGLETRFVRRCTAQLFDLFNWCQCTLDWFTFYFFSKKA